MSEMEAERTYLAAIFQLSYPVILIKVLVKNMM